MNICIAHRLLADQFPLGSDPDGRALRFAPAAGCGCDRCRMVNGPEAVQELRKALARGRAELSDEAA